MSSPDFIKNALSKALGPDKAKELGAAMSSQSEDMGLEALRYIDPIMISNYIRTEHPPNDSLDYLLLDRHRPSSNHSEKSSRKLAGRCGLSYRRFR